jgi:Cysteine dioxygenase type I
VPHAADTLAAAEAGAPLHLPPGLLDGGPLPPARLAEVARHLAGAAGRWRSPVGLGAHRPARARLLRHPDLEVWLLGWAPGQATRVHDHGNAAAAFTVVAGTLVEECLDPTIWTTCRRTTFGARSTMAFGPGHVHLLGNPGRAPALSVHVRSPAEPGRQAQ